MTGTCRDCRIPGCLLDANGICEDCWRESAYDPHTIDTTEDR